VLQADGITVWQVADTAYRPERWEGVCKMGVDVVIPPINGAFGNMDGVTAAKLANDCRAKIAIPCHYWMFAEHGGNPIEFLESCEKYAPDVEPRLMAQGELLVYRT